MMHEPLKIGTISSQLEGKYSCQVRWDMTKDGDRLQLASRLRYLTVGMILLLKGEYDLPHGSCSGQAGSRDRVCNAKKEGERERSSRAYDNEVQSTPGRRDGELIT